MTYIKRLFKKKTIEAEETTDELLAWLKEHNILFEMTEEEIGYKLIYSDVFERIKFEVKFDGSGYYLNGKRKRINEIKTIFQSQNQIDMRMEQCICVPENERVIQIFQFFNELFYSYELNFELIPDDNEHLVLSYKCEEADTWHPLIRFSSDENVFWDIKKAGKVSEYQAVTLILNEIMEEMPLLFDAGDFAVPKDTLSSAYADFTKQYLMNVSLVNRLNKIKNVEANLNLNESISIFIILKNGSAMEYVSPTKQNPSGQIVIMDIDEETMLEDNEEYWLVQQLLKMPDLLLNKPDEQNLPIKKA